MNWLKNIQEEAARLKNWKTRLLNQTSKPKGKRFSEQKIL
jgi:hypothetical protein